MTVCVCVYVCEVKSVYALYRARVCVRVCVRACVCVCVRVRVSECLKEREGKSAEMVVGKQLGRRRLHPIAASFIGKQNFF